MRRFFPSDTRPFQHGVARLIRRTDLHGPLDPMHGFARPAELGHGGAVTKFVTKFGAARLIPHTDPRGRRATPGTSLSVSGHQPFLATSRGGLAGICL